jgi:hypothetical protein
VLVPSDRPQRIVLVTNFGVVLSEDGGQTWSWSCERDENAFGLFYQFGPPPRHRLFAVANDHAITSDDATCSWQVAGGLLADQAVTDVFPDPTDADRVLAVGLAGTGYSVFESVDGGATFGATLYQAPAGDQVTGVEIARADPRIVYVALMGSDRSPRLARTADGGATWTVHDLSAALGPGLPRIIAVDPSDPDSVLVRFAAATGGESVAVTRDGGLTVAKPLSITHYFTSFARLADGALALSAVLSTSPVLKSGLFISHDGAATFQENAAVPTLLALGHRDGLLYAAADNFSDGYALGVSSDEGATFSPVVRFDQIGSIMPCVRANAQCQATCRALAGTGFGSPGKIWEEAVCTGGADPGGCGCVFASDRPGGRDAAAVLAVLVVLGRRRRLTRRGPAPAPAGSQPARGRAPAGARARPTRSRPPGSRAVHRP